MGRIVSFRGQVADGAQEQVALSTNNGLTGYKIVKLEAMAIDSEEDVESTLKVFSVIQTAAVDNTINFSDQTLLAALIYNDSASNAYGPQPVVVFDNIVFNQDIFITLKGSAGVSTPFMNYHIELEQVKLDLNEQSVATLKNIRNSKVQS